MNPTPNNKSDLEIARAVAKKFFSSDSDFTIRLLGEGDCNVNYLVENSNPKVVIKLSKPYREYKALGEYRKESWCIKKSQELGVLTPDILEVSQLDSRAYQIQTFVEGTPGADIDGTSILSQEDQLKVWHKLGEYAKKIHSIKVTGYGETLIDESGTFDGSWEKHVRYNINSLTEDDALRELGVLTAQDSEKILNIFTTLLEKKFIFSLCHNDIALRNTVLSPAGEVYLLDWGTARAEIVPHCDFNEILIASTPDTETLAVFLKGYGMTMEDFEKIRREMLELRLLNTIDTLRWAIDKSPDNIPVHIKNVKGVMAELTL